MPIDSCVWLVSVNIHAGNQLRTLVSPRRKTKRRSKERPDLPSCRISGDETSNVLLIQIPWLFRRVSVLISPSRRLCWMTVAKKGVKIRRHKQLREAGLKGFSLRLLVRLGPKVLTVHGWMSPGPAIGFNNLRRRCHPCPGNSFHETPTP